MPQFEVQYKQTESGELGWFYGELVVAASLQEAIETVSKLIESQRFITVTAKGSEGGAIVLLTDKISRFQVYPVTK